MLIAHECPLILMPDSRNWTDYDYALAHLFRNDLQYYLFFAESRYLNRQIILDNGVFETEQAMDLNEFANWIHKLGPDEYIVPDVLENSSQTVKNCEQWFRHHDYFKHTSIGVVQGTNYDDIVWCYNKLTEMVDKIAISFDYSWYTQVCPHDNKYMSYMYGRQHLLTKLLEDDIFIDMPIHLLGCSLPQEFAFYRSQPKLYNLIQSVDTSNPVVAGLNNVRYDVDGLSTKNPTKLVEYMNMKNIDSNLQNNITYNVARFRRFCNG